MTKRIITINRMYGSNGRKIGQALSEELGIHYYDKELIRIASEKEGIPYEELQKVDEKRASQWRYPLDEPMQMAPQYRFYPMNDVLYQSESEIILSLSEREDCVIIGRCAGHILEKRALRVFIHAPFDYRVSVAAQRMDIPERDARVYVKKMDKERRNYYEYFTDEKWLDITSYDLCIDSSRFTEAQAVQILKAAYEDRYCPEAAADENG